MRMRALFAALSIVVALAGSSSGCAKTPPNVGPAAQTAWKQHEAQKDLDLVRDIAQDAHALNVISESSARAVTVWHRSAITLIHDAPNGWKALVLSGLDELKRNIPPNDYATIARYVSLAKLAIQEIP